MVLQEGCILKCLQCKGIISVQSTLLRPATFKHPGHKQEKFGQILQENHTAAWTWFTIACTGLFQILETLVASKQVLQDEMALISQDQN
jgi:hypothetical protein